MKKVKNMLRRLVRNLTKKVNISKNTGDVEMHISPVSSYRSNPQNQSASSNLGYQNNPQNYGNKAVRPAFEGKIGRGIATAVVATVVSLGAHAQSTAAKTAKAVPDSIPTKILQFNPKEFNIEYLAPWTKTITQESLTADSLKLAKHIALYNKTQATPNGWVGKPVTAKSFSDAINSSWENFFIDKVRYYMATGQMKKPPSSPPNGISAGTQLKIGLQDVSTAMYADMLKFWS